MKKNDITQLSLEQWKTVLKHSPLHFTVISNSMYPAIQTNDEVVIESLFTLPTPGQVLAYHSPKGKAQLTIHRYLGGNHFKGDNNLFKDPYIDSARIIGIVTHTTRDNQPFTVSHNPIPWSISRAILSTIRKLIYFTRKGYKQCIK